MVSGDGIAARGPRELVVDCAAPAAAGGADLFLRAAPDARASPRGDGPMRIVLPGKRNQALTLEEVLMVVAVVMILIAIALPVMMQPHASRAQRMNCVNNLKQVGLAY